MMTPADPSRRRAGSLVLAGLCAAVATLDADARFAITGEYLIDAFPVASGPPGPTTVRLGREPEMQICPICVMRNGG